MMLQGGKFKDTQVVSKSIINLMTQNHFPDNKQHLDMMFIKLQDQELIDREKGYGFGLGVRVKVEENMSNIGVGTHLWGGALNTIYAIDPLNEVIFIVLTQHCPNDNYWIQPIDPVKLDNLLYKALEIH
jgi:CubicO group peptidase (beta-lactamase class C family)